MNYDFDLKLKKNQPIYLRCKLCLKPSRVVSRIFDHEAFEFYQVGNLETLCDSCASTRFHKYTLFNETFQNNPEAVQWHLLKRLADLITWEIKVIKRHGSMADMWREYSRIPGVTVQG